jgi:hypothetical protein
VLASGVFSSEESETEWKEDMDDAGACPFPSVTFIFDRGGYVCSIMSEPDGFGSCRDEVLAALRADTEFPEEADLREEYDGFRGGRGGAASCFGLGGDSRLINGVLDFETLF